MIPKPHSELAEIVRQELLRPISLRDPNIAMSESLAALTELEEQFETQKTKMTTLYAGYSAKCERWSLGTCDVYPDGKRCRICQFFTDLGYESFEVTSGGLRSWRPVPNPATKPMTVEAERDAFADGLIGYAEIEEAIRRGDLSDEEGLAAFRAHTATLADEPSPATSSGTEPVSRREVAGVSVPEASSPASEPSSEWEKFRDAVNAGSELFTAEPNPASEPKS